MHRLLLCCLLLSGFSGVFTSCLAQTKVVDTRSFLVCGDSKIHLVDSALSKETTPHVLWTWDAHLIQDLPEEFRTRKFNSIDDIKPVRGGTQLLISSSSGAVALWDVERNKTLFYASVSNAHSIEFLPGGLLVAAASTHAAGNKLMLFDPTKGRTPVFTDDLHSAHGVVWHEERQTLFALGFDVLREYQVEGSKLKRIHEWKIPGESGHDLTLSPDKRCLFLTEHTGAWGFDLDTMKFSKIEGFPDAPNIKSLSLAMNGQYLYTVPETDWWTHHVSLCHPSARLAFPGMRVYKARWYKE
jgi:WD40 repeat protein